MGCLILQLLIQWSWVAKRRSKVVRYLILGREVYLLKQLGGNGDAASCPNFPKGCLTVRTLIQMKMAVRTSRMILF
jgi:hypothetical protein